MRILIIEDEPRLALSLKIALQGLHEVLTLESGRAALTHLRENPTYDLILTDLSLPDLPGPDLYEAIIGEEPELASKFVFMTGGAFTDRTRRFLASVPNRRLDKPFEMGEVEAILQEHRQSS